MMNDPVAESPVTDVVGQDESGARGMPSSHLVNSWQPAELKDIAKYIANVVSESLLAALRDNVGQAYLMGLSGGERCTLTGLRRRQFERFCEIMRENPTEAPFRAAKAVLAELDGRGGYTRASSLQRYAGMHRKSW